jgi:hypothetical protein
MILWNLGDLFPLIPLLYPSLCVHCSGGTDRQTDRQTDRRTDRVDNLTLCYAKCAKEHLPIALLVLYMGQEISGASLQGSNWLFPTVSGFENIRSPIFRDSNAFFYYQAVDFDHGETLTYNSAMYSYCQTRTVEPQSLHGTFNVLASPLVESSGYRVIS